MTTAGASMTTAVNTAAQVALLEPISLTENLAMGSNKITGLATGTDSTDVVNKAQLDATAATAAAATAALDISDKLDKDGTVAMDASLNMDSQKVINLTNGTASSDATAYGQLTSHTGDSTKHFTVGSIDHGSIAGISDDDHTQYVLVDGSRAMTGGLTINSTDGLTVVGAAPQLKISDSSTDEATKKGFITLAHDDNAEEDFCIVYARSQDLVAKLSIGGGHSSVNAASAVSIYVAANGDTVTGTELIRVKTTGMRIGGSGNPTASCILDLGSVSGQTFLPPKGTTSNRDAISQETGSIYYNTSTNKLQCHNGSGWQDCF